MYRTVTTGFATVPRVPLAMLPTPLTDAPGLRQALGGPARCPRILLKRDDLTGLALGGNKARKLEFLIGDAQRQGATTVVTTGAVQSNHARMTAAAARVPVLLDGVIAGAAALVTAVLCPLALEHALAGHTSAEPGHALALRALGLRPLLGLDLRLGEGTGALLALPLVASAARALRDVATFDSAGVTEK